MNENKAIDWKKKLSSRKFWAGFAGWITSILAAFNVTESVVAQVSLIIAGIGSLAVYMLAEGMADKANADTAVELSTVIEDNINHDAQ